MANTKKRINLIDLTFVLVVAIFLGGIITLWLWPNRELRDINRLARRADFSVHVLLDPQDAWLAEKIPIGSGSFDLDLNYRTKVVGIEHIENGDLRGRVLVHLDVVGRIDNRGLITCGSAILRVGGPFRFRSHDIDFSGRIYNLREQSP